METSKPVILAKESKMGDVNKNPKKALQKVKLIKNFKLIYDSNRVAAYVHLVP